jgi:hypothetical protein
MMDDWQMSEVFQDLPTFDNDAFNALSPVCAANKTADANDLELLEKQLLAMDSTPSKDLPAVNDTKDTQTATAEEENVFSIDLDLGTVIDEAFGSGGLQGFDLLEQLEALDDAPSATPPGSAGADVVGFSAVESDHQYTQLSTIEIKPHETKKQAIRRVKNNAASKVCRKQRKNKFAANMEKVAELTEANKRLKAAVDSVQSLVALLNDHLVRATTSKACRGQVTAPLCGKPWGVARGQGPKGLAAPTDRPERA